MKSSEFIYSMYLWLKIHNGLYLRWWWIGVINYSKQSNNIKIIQAKIAIHKQVDWLLPLMIKDFKNIKKTMKNLIKYVKFHAFFFLFSCFSILYQCFQEVGDSSISKAKSTLVSRRDFQSDALTKLIKCQFHSCIKGEYWMAVLYPKSGIWGHEGASPEAIVSENFYQKG